ncbi:MAG TPA: patatin-like phospholipase family protein [Longimicrobiaceae bacterium]|nr:patatin-like phospholipase family protein [Longimicrobiaceae bacterium]
MSLLAPARTAEAAAMLEAAALPEPAATPQGGRGPLGPIALSLSGGGYRAAGFHLGVLKLLDEAGLLGSVAALSTVSGGTIVGARWVRGLLDGEPFAEFSAGFADFLRRTNVVREALATLTERDGGAAHPSLIRAAARVYASPAVVGERRLGEVLDAPHLPLEEVIFNATEFHSGVDFRFRRSRNPAAVIGNGHFRVPRPVAAEVRLADVVAASSCFPSVFEPFLFPDHFAWPAAFPLERVRGELGEGFAGGLPLMDGGVYDNQGVASLLLAYAGPEPPPLLLISDTSPPEDNLYPDYPAPRPRGFLTLRAVAWLGRLVFVLSLASAVMLVIAGAEEVREEGFSFGELLLYGIPFVFTGGVAAGLLWLRRVMGEVEKQLRAQVQIARVWSYLRKLTVMDLITLVETRVTSLLALTASIFMKRIRGLVFNTVFRDERYDRRRVPNLIYGLTLDHRKLFEAHPWLRPGERLQQLARDASAVPTTLWVDTEEQLAQLVDAGYATTCFSLLRHLVGDPEEAWRRPGSPAAELYERLRETWRRLNGT